MKPLHTLLFALLLTACSTTGGVPDDEQLYMGIDRTDYSGAPTARTKIRRDSVGVITTIGDAVRAVDNILEGRADDGIVGKLREDARSALTPKEERTQERREAEQEAAVERAAFETVKEEVEAVLAYPPNNALFGSSSLHSPIQIGLWVNSAYANSETKFGKWMNKTFGTQPVLISNVSPELRAKVAQNTLHNYGFFRGQVSHEVVTLKNPKKARVRYNVSLGPLTRLDSVEYRGFVGRQDSLLRASESRALLKRGKAFSVVDLANEQTRLGTLFREDGYYFWQDAYTTYQADTLQVPQRAQLRVQPKAGVPQTALRPWYIGHTYIAMRRSERDVLGKERTRRNTTYRYSGELPPLRPGMWRHAISHRHGEPYRYSDQQHTLEKLSALGLFSQMDVSYVARDTTATCDTLDIMVSALLDKPYDSDFEMNATLRSNQQVGPGISYSLNRRNAFRGGETIGLKLFGSYEWQIRTGKTESNSLLDSYELGAQLSLKYPRFFAPFLSRRRLRFPAETTFALDGDWKRRAGFFTMVTAGVSATYTWHKFQNVVHELTPLSIEFDKTIDTSPTFDSIMTMNPALDVSMRDQFVPSMAYTLTYTTAARHRNPLWLQLHFKEGGNLTSAAYVLAGRGWTEADKKLLGSPFAQFLKSSAEVHHSVALTHELTLASRFFAGAVWSYANSSRAPYAEQFYVGGANSIRGFMVRSIGPGRYKSPNLRYAYIDQTGEMKLEANVELRAHLFGSLHGAFFLDAGNVWLLRQDTYRPESQFTLRNLSAIAVGTGLGVRYDLDFIVLRLDLGVGLHAPYETSHGGFFNMRRLGDMLNLHFAIGYPF